MATTLLTVFARLALLPASLGTYGAFSYFITRHTVYIGVRHALERKQETFSASL